MNAKDRALIKAMGGTRREALMALRDKLAAELAGETGFHTVGLARELREVLRELDTLADEHGEVSGADGIVDGIADELAQRRKRQVRRPTASDS